MSDDLCTLCRGLSAVVYSTVSNDECQKVKPPWHINIDESREVKSMDSPWHTTLDAVHKSSLACRLCSLVMEGWSQSRAVQVEKASRQADFNVEDPPPDLDYAVYEIPVYRYGAKVEISIYSEPGLTWVEGGKKNQMGEWHLVFACNVNTSTSFEVHDSLEAFLRIVRGCDEDVAGGIRRDTACTPDALQIHPITPGTNAEFASSVVSVASSNPLSRQSMTIAKQWLEHCVKEHTEICRTSGKLTGWIPTRLLEIVPGSTKTYLREKTSSGMDIKSEDNRYVALSHCWGVGGSPFITTQKTLPHRVREGIDISELPQTFRDAVILVAGLGLRYLWIDSLCILQDDSQDWANEAAQMADIYRHAHMVINAANSSGDTLGFLNKREAPDMVRLPSFVPLPVSSCPTTTTTTTTTSSLCLCLQLLPHSNQWFSFGEGLDHLHKEPLSTRAWCLQERYLPVRALQYGTRQTYWECQSMRASEDGYLCLLGTEEQGGHIQRLVRTANLPVSVFARGEYREAHTEPDGMYNWFHWYQMVQDYTARDISKPTDRLPAIAGLAKAVVKEKGKDDAGLMKKMENGYMAGLWKSAFLEGLFWCKATGSIGQRQQLTPPEEYVAPSWSWASVLGPVHFPVYDWYSRAARWKARMADFEPLVEYVSHAVELVGQDPFGRLAGGRLTVKAPLFAVRKVNRRQDRPPPSNTLFGEPPRRSEVADSVYQLQDGKKNHIWVEGGMDVALPDDKETELAAMFLFRLPFMLDHGFLDQRFGLLLKRLDGGCFRRVGFIDGVLLKEAGPYFFKRLEIIGYHHDVPSVDSLRSEKQELTIC
ncbi:heterokaryon incompatibility protein-domain-containing protein [Triangularia setosa]|uniref:Heterokaryon incompatibility protein-domain-containing protein n=1 Tax=Triangularia setosa TaxID=2587417 RepID=A0AAN6W0J9_9PEZI|nr:heterokaryon incompatibility protein-domain-containing protein [Podospora setosa]